MVLCNERMKEREKMMVTLCMLGSVGSAGTLQWKKMDEVSSFGGGKAVDGRASSALSLEKL